MAELKRFAANTAFNKNTILNGDVFPFQHAPNEAGDCDGKITVSELKEKMNAGMATTATCEATYQKKLTAGTNVEITDNNTINVDIADVYVYKGSVPTYADLPTENLKSGWVYNTEETEMNYAWNGTAWDQLGANAVIADLAVTTSKIANKAITLPKVSDEVPMYDVGCVCSSSADAAEKEVTINNFVLKSGVVLKVLFTNANTASNPKIKIVDSEGTVIANKAIMSVRGGEKIVPVTHSGKWRGADTYTDEMWQAYTTLELMYDGTDWVIMGNPLFESYVASDGSKGYSVYADGMVEQWGSKLDSGSGWTNVTLSLDLEMTTTEYIICVGDYGSNVESEPGSIGIFLMNKQYNSFMYRKYNAHGKNPRYMQFNLKGH